MSLKEKVLTILISGTIMLSMAVCLGLMTYLTGILLGDDSAWLRLQFYFR